MLVRRHASEPALLPNSKSSVHEWSVWPRAFSRFQLQVRSRPHSWICASSCAHTQLHTHTHSLGPSIPASFLRGSWEEPAEGKAPWASAPSAQAGRGRLCQAAPRFEAELLGEPSSRALAQAPPFQESPAPTCKWYLPKASSLGQVAESGIWTLSAAASSHMSRSMGRPSASGQLGEKASFSWQFLLEPKSTHPFAFDSIGWTRPDNTWWWWSLDWEGG